MCDFFIYFYCFCGSNVASEHARKDEARLPRVKREGGGGGTERGRERERENSNSKTLFYKDCSLGSVKNLSIN